jgi:hypothetical protein
MLLVKLTKSKLRHIIAEEVALILQDVETVEDAWAGGDNLVDRIDYQKLASGEKAISCPESLPDPVKPDDKS